MPSLYRMAVGAYHLGLRAAAKLGNRRARAWVAGRQIDVSTDLAAIHQSGRPVLWLHAASLGEFEQGRPVLEAFREARPDWAVVVTFFSPSGYERCRNTELAELVAYLPEDLPRQAADWMVALRPRLAVFVKYEFWYFHLRELQRAGVPTYLIAGSFRHDQPFFKWYGDTWREMLGTYSHFAVQTEGDRDLLHKLGYDNVTVTGDPRIDRTLALAQAPFHDRCLADFTRDAPTLIAGSVWPADVDVILGAWPALRDQWKLILAPHQLEEHQLAAWTNFFNADRYTGGGGTSRVLILDTIGILSRAYRYGTVAFIGGGYGGGGLHNTLEPMSYGLPVLFGPRYQKFPEATAAVKLGGAFPITSTAELTRRMQILATDTEYNKATEAQQTYLTANRGAAAKTVRLLLQSLVLIMLATLPLGAQTWAEADRLTSTLDGVFAKCNLMVAVSNVNWRPGLCLAGAELAVGETVSLQLQLAADTRYVFIAGGEAGTADVDLYLRDSSGTVIDADSEVDDTPVIEFVTDHSGAFTLQLHLVAAAEKRNMVGLGILVAGGIPQTERQYAEASNQFGAAAGAVRAAGGAKVFRYGPGSWCVFGYLLGSGEGATVEQLALQPGRQFFTATGPESFRDINLYLAAAENDKILRYDGDADAFPMIDYRVKEVGNYRLRVEVERARGMGLVLLGLFTD